MKGKGFFSRIVSLFSSSKKDEEEFLENLEDALIEGDFGARNAMTVSDAVREMKPKTEEDLVSAVISILSDKIDGVELNPPKDDLSVYMMLGVNGVGKTTSTAKLAQLLKKSGNRVLFAAADTFRAAAIDQLQMHADRVGVRIVRQNNGSDPGAVVYDAITSAQSQGENIILCDTAGRMHNKENLVRELQKINKIITARVKPENFKKILVIDATTGQNAVSQAQVFNEAVGIDAVILTKYDSMSKGGALFQLGIPVAFICDGEGYDDIHPFDKESFLKSISGLE